VAGRVREGAVARLGSVAQRPALGRLRGRRIGEATGHDATLVADVGQNQMWTARYGGFRRPNSHISSGGLGTMGFGLPAAMGAAVGRPDKETWAIVGDGGLQMTVQELMTLVQEHIPSGSRCSTTTSWAWSGSGRSSSTRATTTRRTCSARTGASWPRPTEWPAFRADEPEEVDAAIAAARAVDGPALIEFVIAEQQNVFPMMPAGKGLSDLLEEQFEEPKQ
jgi:acetolactate synthase-1/2/3 large subunit